MLPKIAGGSVYVTYMFCSEHINDLVKHWSAKQISMNEECLHSIAGCWVVTFGVSYWKKNKMC